jgi:hypothetical protein
VEEFRTGAGATNAYPLVGPVVITEIMYHPPDLGTNDNTRDEFIELRNLGVAPVALFEGTNGWRLRDAVDFDFPPDTVLPPGGRLLVVGFDPMNNPAALAAFQETYSLLPGGVPILGPWSGKLANDTDDLELRRPDVPDTNGTPYLLVERVGYADGAPWPPEADGTGLSLQRRADREFANDPANWLADAPTPGPTNPAFDSDHDGLPDAWEIAHGLDPVNPLDAAFDADGDGLTNLEEFLRDTDPRDPASGLRLSITVDPSGNLLLSFTAAANFAHAIERTDALSSAWQLLQDFSAAPTSRIVQLTVPTSGGGGFFRLRSP